MILFLKIFVCSIMAIIVITNIVYFIKVMIEFIFKKTKFILEEDTDGSYVRSVNSVLWGLFFKGFFNTIFYVSILILIFR